MNKRAAINPDIKDLGDFALFESLVLRLFMHSEPGLLARQFMGAIVAPVRGDCLVNVLLCEVQSNR
jgi:hypothetical protein